MMGRPEEDGVKETGKDSKKRKGWDVKTTKEGKVGREEPSPAPYGS